MSSRRRVIDDRLYAHFLTFSVYRRRRLLDHDHPKKIVLGVLNEELRQRDAQCIGFVVLPSRVHVRDRKASGGLSSGCRASEVGLAGSVGHQADQSVVVAQRC